MVTASDNKGAFTLVELLVVLAIVLILAALALPNLMLYHRSGGSALECKANLKAIHFAAYSYALKMHAFPVAEGGEVSAHASLNVLLSTPYGEMLTPEMFVCPKGEARKAETTDGRFALDRDTNSYAWTSDRLPWTAPETPLASDKYAEHPDIRYADGASHAGHRGELMVLFTNGSVTEVEVPEDSDLLTDDYLPRGLVR